MGKTMPDVNRRDAVILSAAALAALSLPSSAEPVPTPEQLETFEKTKVWVGALDRAKIEDELYNRTEYRRIFGRIQPSDYMVPVSHCAYRGEHSAAVIHDDAPRASSFIFNAEIKPIGLGFVVEPAMTASAFQATTAALVRSVAYYREIEAAEILNHAHLYNLSVGGDGVALCSPHHPHETGVWANAFETYRPLTSESLMDAAEQIANTFVDQRGLRILVKAKTLVVPQQLEAQAKLLTEGVSSPVQDYVVLRSLSDADSWFVTTTAHGLSLFEKTPFQIVAELQPKTFNTLVVGSEKRVFAYTDPRALFGSVKPGRRKDLLAAATITEAA